MEMPRTEYIGLGVVLGLTTFEILRHNVSAYMKTKEKLLNGTLTSFDDVVNGFDGLPKYTHFKPGAYLAASIYAE